jgi:hypothetical protein
MQVDEKRKFYFGTLLDDSGSAAGLNCVGRPGKNRVSSVEFADKVCRRALLICGKGAYEASSPILQS